MKKAFVAVMVAAFVFGGEAAGQDRVPGLGTILSYQLDISRCKVPKMETVYRIAAALAQARYARCASPILLGRIFGLSSSRNTDAFG